MDAKWSPISVLTMVLVTQLQLSDHSPSLPSLLDHACCTVEMLAISRVDEK